MINYSKPIIVIAGPTASGKSDMGIRLAKDINGYIINGDSRQIYKELNIGTAKPKPDEILKDGTWLIEGIPHYLFDFIDPKENYTLFDYQRSVQNVLDTVDSKIPIIVGGTGLYIDSIVYNYELNQSTSVDSNLSEKSIEQLQEIAKPYISKLNDSDKQNRHRLIRVIQKQGLEDRKGTPLKHIYFVLDIERDLLKNRMLRRTYQMFEQGLLEENISLLNKGYTFQDKGMRSIGYQEFEEYFNNKITLDQVRDNIYKHTVQYAKRQRTWFRRNKNVIWTDNYDRILELALNFINIE